MDASKACCRCGGGTSSSGSEKCDKGAIRSKTEAMEKKVKPLKQKLHALVEEKVKPLKEKLEAEEEDLEAKKQKKTKMWRLTKKTDRLHGRAKTLQAAIAQKE